VHRIGIYSIIIRLKGILRNVSKIYNILGNGYDCSNWKISKISKMFGMLPIKKVNRNDLVKYIKSSVGIFIPKMRSFMYFQVGLK
jgi:hypothetical protein